MSGPTERTTPDPGQADINAAGRRLAELAIKRTDNEEQR